MILIIVAYGAAKPIEESRGIKATFRQEAAVTAAPVAPVKPVTDDDDDVDILALIGDDDGKKHNDLKIQINLLSDQMTLMTVMMMMIWTFWELWPVRLEFNQLRIL